jgi:hypothetical protein
MMPYKGPRMGLGSSSKYPIFRGLAAFLTRWMAHLSHDIGRNYETLTESHMRSVPRVPRWGQLEDGEIPQKAVETSVFDVKRRLRLTSSASTRPGPNESEARRPVIAKRGCHDKVDTGADMGWAFRLHPSSWIMPRRSA